MIEVIKYIDATWYYSIQPENESKCLLLDYRKLSNEEKSLIEFDPNYEKLSQADASYQAIKKGIISTRDIALNKADFKNIPVSDYYRFLRKYYHLGWSMYYFLTRILQLHNPFKELKYLYKSLRVKRSSLYDKVALYNLNGFVLKDNYKVSIILPSLNRYEYLLTILKDIELQSISPFEIIIVDQSYPRNRDFYNSFQHLPLKVIYQEMKGQWFARNEAIRQSQGDYLLFVDDDSSVDKDWIEQHLKCIQFFGCDISAGVSINDGEILLKGKKIYHYSEEFDTGNALVRRNVFEKIGLFDNIYNGLRRGDTEFGLRAYLKGCVSISNPMASRYHIIASKGGMRDWFSVNSFKPMNFFGPRPDRGTLYLFKNYFDRRYLIAYLLIRIYRSYIPLSLHSHLFGRIIAALFFILFAPYWVLSLMINILKVSKYTSKIPSC